MASSSTPGGLAGRGGAIAAFGNGSMYVNFTGDGAEDRVRASYPGEVYDRLVRVKDSFDPANLFRLNQNIRPSAGT